jgi:hypothetical protein
MILSLTNILLFKVIVLLVPYNLWYSIEICVFSNW